MNRRNQIIIAIVVGVAIVAGTFRLWIPLFSNQVVDEAFPDLTVDQRDQIREMPEDQQAVLVEMAEENAEMASETALAMLEGDTEMEEDMPEDEPTVLFTGSFNEFDPLHRGNGTATIYELADGSRVLRFEDFSTTNGPDLRVRLVTSVPANIRQDATENHIELGPLKGNVGNQNYVIPDDVDLSIFEAALIYCYPFGINFTVAAFE
ncbi:MAG: DM13 domain-containing protein [Chloroflexota bacterium]